MPELPEVECIKRALECHLPGRTITDIEVFSPRLRTPLESLKSPELIGRSFKEIRRRGRYLTLDLTEGGTLLVHLGMSGVIRIEEGERPRAKHEHLFIHLDNQQTLRFECVRRFSIFEFHPEVTAGQWPEELNKLGVEPLTEEFSAQQLFENIRSRNMPIKNLLMDNAIVVGVGNIYVTEVLFQTHIHPLTPGKLITKSECEKLVPAIKEILARAISDGGTTFDAYRHVDGSEGQFVQQLSAYGCKGKPCPRCGTIFEAVTVGGRTSVFCPKCQKLRK